jgi:hypothetical protein
MLNSNAITPGAVNKELKLNEIANWCPTMTRRITSMDYGS